jgi:hypothetical protein
LYRFTSTIEVPTKRKITVISGKFEVLLIPLETYTEDTNGIKFGRMAIDKTFFGPLSAVSQGEMLSTQAPLDGSAGYVAIEHVSGELEGKQGSFVLQHYGLQSGGDQQLTLEVVPDSGTGDLSGLSGKMAIRVEADQHYYDFDYRL